MAKTQKIEPRTKRFAELHKELSDKKLMPSHGDLAKLLGYERKQSITEILKQRQNIDFDKWAKFLDHFKIKEQSSTETSGPSQQMEIDYKEKYYSLLEKENVSKDKTIEKLSLAVDNIKVIDNKVERLNFTVNDLQGKFSNLDPIVLGLQEFVTEEIAGLKKISREAVAAALGNKVAAYRKKA